MSNRALASQATQPVVTPTEMVLRRASGASALPLGPLERKVVAQVDGVRTIAEIAPMVGLSPTETARLAARLVQLGAVEIGSSSGTDAEIDEGWDASDARSEKDDLLARRTIRR